MIFDICFPIEKANSFNTKKVRFRFEEELKEHLDFVFGYLKMRLKLFKIIFLVACN